MLTKIIKAFLLSILIFSSTFALNVTSEIKLDEATSDSLQISWDAVDEALCYSVYYDTVSPEDGNYTSDEMCIDTNEYILENLDASTTYYVAVSVISQDLVEGEKSEEVIFSTLQEGETSTGTTREEQDNSILLKIENTDVLNTTQLKLTFNISLDKDSQREFKVVNKEDTFVELSIESSEIVGDNQVIVTLGDELLANTEYTLTVLSLLGVNGENIELGVDGISNFIVPADVSTLNKESISDNLTEAIVDEENLELNAAGEEGNSNTVTESKNAETLPTTGPENAILILLALLVAIGLLKFRFKKS
ncbi:MAG: fibronectin type III domain-containing protein [Candidatus Gracilibacteria bacterium]|nr:fibronectin type III domain-containing protein [Candidatus Gracilibacteria bacterium]